tara:strand:- start:48 stop:803 length:756 start_codon:yes stop_codon:yes gene_type:complete
MNLDEAYDLMDLLLDKADQPYFTTEEKNDFLSLAIADFVNFHYQKMTADEDSRRAMAALIDWNSFSLSGTEILAGTTFADKYDDSTSNDDKGFFKYGSQYILPKNHLYVLSIAVDTYNRGDIIDSSGDPYPGVTASDIVYKKGTSLKNKSTREFYEDAYSDDPFNNTKDGKNRSWQYIENRLTFSNGTSISYINIQTITLPTTDRAFSDETYDSSSSPASRVFNEHYQKQIVEIAVSKMTKVDVGLMTPPS